MQNSTPAHSTLLEHLDDVQTLLLFTDFLAEKDIHISPDEILCFLGIDPVQLEHERTLLLHQTPEYHGPTYYA